MHIATSLSGGTSVKKSISLPRLYSLHVVNILTGFTLSPCTCAGSSAVLRRLSGLSAGSLVLLASGGLAGSAGAQGRASDQRKKTGRPGDGWSWVATGQRV